MKTEKKLTSKIPKIPKGGAILPLYHACEENAVELLEEAEILFAKKRYARAFFLAFTALEEIGKSQLVADYLTDCISEEEFQDAFRKHAIKVSYLYRYILVPDEIGQEEARIEYDKEESKDNIRRRMESLYVSLTDNHKVSKPKDNIDRNTAMEMIDEVKEHLSSIINAEWLNQRIGSKGLFK